MNRYQITNIETKQYLFTLLCKRSQEQSVNDWIAVNKQGRVLAEKKFMEHSDFNEIKFAFKKELNLF